jgi:hypothetical protein
VGRFGKSGLALFSVLYQYNPLQLFLEKDKKEKPLVGA